MNTELLEAARDLIPGLRDRSGRCEAERRVPPETVADLIACGLTRMTQPKKFGGRELAWHSLCEVIAELAKGCASTWAPSAGDPRSFEDRKYGHVPRYRGG